MENTFKISGEDNTVSRPWIKFIIRQVIGIVGGMDIDNWEDRRDILDDLLRDTYDSLNKREDLGGINVQESSKK